jgi:hypothetical protein
MLDLNNHSLSVQYKNYTLSHCQHPSKFVINTFKRHGQITYFYLAKYNVDKCGEYDYHYNSTNQYITLPIDKISSTRDIIEVCGARGMSEIGITSLVKTIHGNANLPMIDFIGRPPIEEIQQLCIKLADIFNMDRVFEIYDSGNSYHAYFASLLEPDHYKEYLSLLKDYSIVDRGWVHYALRGQTPVAVLRWSAFTGIKGVISKIA